MLDGDEYVVNGTKTWITNARHADPLPVLVKTDPDGRARPTGACRSCWSRPDTPGMHVTRDLGKLGYKGPETCEVVLDDARVPVSGPARRAWRAGAWGRPSPGLQTGRVNIAARAVGVAHRALEEALSYSGDRDAFGQPIGDFQAVQLKLADMATKVQAARSLTWWAAGPPGRGRATPTLESAMAKLFASEVALEASLEAMRIHGGYGYSTEFEVERLYRDAPLMAIGEGTNDILRTVIAKGLRPGGIPE